MTDDPDSRATAPAEAHRDALLYPPDEPWQRALDWWRHAAALAPELPLPLVADLGLLLTDALLAAAALSHLPASPYAAFLQAAAAAPAVGTAHTLRLSDTVVVAILAHLAQHAPAASLALSDLSDLSDLFDHLLTRLQALKPADIHFLHLLGTDTLHATDLANLRALTDLLALPALNHDILDEILALLPALAEVNDPRGSQTYTIDGISGVARRGSLDSVIPTEWAFPADLVSYRYLNGELLYYGRERPPEQRSTLLLLLLQAGDAMAGDADMVGRALTLALARAAAAHGTTVQFCWFDRHLHPPQRLTLPSEIAAFLHATHSGRVNLTRVLLDVQTLVRAHSSQYAHIEIQWLLHAHSGSDQVGSIRGIARQLRNQAGCRVLFLCAGKPPEQPPALANILAARWALLPSDALHDAETRELALRALRQIARPTGREHLPPEKTTTQRRSRPQPDAESDHARYLLNIGEWAEALQLLEQRIAAGDQQARFLLVELVQEPRVPLALRIQAARELGKAGDPRLLDLETGNAPTGDYWRSVTAGTFWYGDDRIGDPLQQITLPYSFKIARFPVTNSEYILYVEAHRQGRQKVPRPDYWNDRHYNQPNQPVVGVSWHDAVGYCRWLTAQGHTRGWLPRAERLRLPTSLEWERAARHDDWRRYPWGNAQPEGERANYRLTGIGAPTPVGCFPGGAAVCGAQDMVGNTMELMATSEALPLSMQPFAQPGQNVLILGSYNDFGDSEYLLYCGSRIKYYPDYSSRLCGFRVAWVRDES